MTYKKITQETRETWSRLHSEGVSYVSIAKKFGTSPQTVSRSVRGLTKAVGRPRRTHNNEDNAARHAASYVANRERIIARQTAYYRDNQEARKEYQRGQNAMVRGRAAEIEQTIIRMFEMIPEGAREEYAHWLLFLADHDRFVAQAVRGWKVDGLLGAYSGI